MKRSFTDPQNGREVFEKRSTTVMLQVPFLISFNSSVFGR